MTAEHSVTMGLKLIGDQALYIKKGTGTVFRINECICNRILVQKLNLNLLVPLLNLLHAKVAITKIGVGLCRFFRATPGEQKMFMTWTWT